MLIEIDLGSETPIYEQLIWEIKSGIATDELKPGEEMPSVRNLAGDLEINLHTVNKAYKLLADQQILVRQRNRFIVNQPTAYDQQSNWHNDFEALLSKIAIEAKLHGLSINELSAAQKKMNQKYHLK